MNTNYLLNQFLEAAYQAAKKSLNALKFIFIFEHQFH